MQTRVLALAATVVLLLAAAPSGAIEVTETADANTLVNALLGGGGSGIDLASVVVSLSGQSGGGVFSTGTYTNASGTYGIGDGIVLSSGAAGDYGDGPNTFPNNSTNFGTSATPAQENLLDQITGGALDHNDVTELTLEFDMLVGFDTIFFNVTWGSEEYAEYIGTSFIDAFGLFVNGVNIASVNGAPVNVDHPDMGALRRHRARRHPRWRHRSLRSSWSTRSQSGVSATGNTLTFIIADSGDNILDSTVYLSQLGGEPPEPTVPEPATLVLLAGGLLGVSALRRRRNR